MAESYAAEKGWVYLTRAMVGLIEPAPILPVPYRSVVVIESQLGLSSISIPRADRTIRKK